MKTFLKLIPLTAFVPGFAFALGEFTQVQGMLTGFTTIINNILVPLVFAIAFLMFLWGMFKTFILGGSDEGKQTEGKQLMMYSIIGFMVMVAIWGIVNLLLGEVGITGGGSISIPSVPGQ
jgi:hypothetical protein